ncbi:hypothetical protein HDV00_000732 [Rhizophlyctis rosea]|nr:hypothetical protein HDV00_000732 [Rhizophlyctis rosea]
MSTNGTGITPSWVESDRPHQPETDSIASDSSSFAGPRHIVVGPRFLDPDRRSEFSFRADAVAGGYYNTYFPNGTGTVASTITGSPSYIQQGVLGAKVAEEGAEGEVQQLPLYEGRKHYSYQEWNGDGVAAVGAEKKDDGKGDDAARPRATSDSTTQVLGAEGSSGVRPVSVPPPKYDDVA